MQTLCQRCSNKLRERHLIKCQIALEMKIASECGVNRFKEPTGCHVTLK